MASFAKTAAVGNFAQSSRGSMTARERLYAFLETRPAGADAHELAGVLLRGVGSDPELAPRMIAAMLGGDPNFAFDPDRSRWTLARSQSLKIPLDQARFVVVDIETTGARVGPGAIIEIGAVRMEGGQIVANFQTLVRPGGPIARFVTALTSISNEMVRDAPPIASAISEFRRFLGDAVMVAHNARFDFSYLDFEMRRACGIGITNPLLCTLRLARRFLPSLRRRGLDALAQHFGLSTEGRHRGLGDARMAAELLSILLDIARRNRLDRLDLLLDHQDRGLSGRHLERHVASEEIAALPHAPGVYLMRNERGELLYIGKARDLRRRVASYFSGIGRNARVADLVSHVWNIETRITPSALEAALLEARLIREHKPPHNRMLKSAPAVYFITLDLMDTFPRLLVRRTLAARRGLIQLGPFAGGPSLQRGVRALARLLGMRTCAGRLEPDADFTPCLYGQIGHCTRPCNLGIGQDAYDARVRGAIEFLRGRPGRVMGALVRARDEAAAAMRFEQAQRHSRDLQDLAALASRTDRLSRIVTENNLAIVTGAADARRVHIVLGGRLALTLALDKPETAREASAFVAENYERYRLAPVTRADLEPMMIVARWLLEREENEGRLIHLGGPALDPALLAAPA